MEIAQTLGCSIYEAQHRITIDEFPIWLSYRKRYGSLSVSTAVKFYGALNAYWTAIGAGAKSSTIKIADFLPSGWYEDDDSADLDVPMTAEESKAMQINMRMMLEKVGGGKQGKTRFVVRKRG